MRLASVVVLLLLHQVAAVVDPEFFRWEGKLTPVHMCFAPCQIITTRLPGPQKEFCACESVGHRRFLKFNYYVRAGIKVYDSNKSTGRRFRWAER
uniref:Secreted protein n=1 Tax=Steinernema glaseri TaxID=37863 RepID=A0A1I8AAT8_9BILA